jgi:outer membrane protein assembly factor BamA
VWSCDLQPRIRLLGTIVQQDMFHWGVRFDAEGGLDYLAIEAYTMQGARLRLGLSRALWTRRIQARIGWQLAGYDFIDLSPAVDPTYMPEIGRATADDPALAGRLGIDTFQRLGAFTQGIVFDYRDSPASARKGVYAELRVAEGTALAGGAFDYVQVTPDLRAYLPLGRNVLAARARLGVIRGEVPPTERYYAGGAASQRGFAERRLSPTATGVAQDGTPVTVVIGGAASFETGLELRSTVKPFGYKLGVAVFLDGADVTETPGQLALGNLHWAAGIGFRPVYLPVGPIRLDIGYRLNRTGMGNPQPGDRWTWFLSVGESY